MRALEWGRRLREQNFKEFGANVRTPQTDVSMRYSSGGICLSGGVWMVSLFTVSRNTVCAVLMFCTMGLARAQQPQQFWTQAGTAPIKIKQPALEFLLEGHEESLLRYLEAHPAWRVGIERSNYPDTIVAYWRPTTESGLNGHFEIDDVQVWRGFVLSEGNIENPAMAHVPAIFGATAGSVVVPLHTYRLLPQFGNGVVYVGEPGFWYRSSERSRSASLPITQRMLDDLETELAALKTVIENGQTYVEALPAEAITIGEPRVEIEAPDSEMIVGKAWVNPGEPGVTEWRVRRAEGGAALSFLRPELYCRERVGYSDDPRKLFFAKSDLCIMETATGWDTKHDVVFELWFTADAGGPERKLIEHRMIVDGWER